MDLLLKLVETADVILENYRPGVVAKLGIDYDTLSKINPRLVYASVSGYGQSGPYKNRKVYDPLVQGTTGIAVAQGVDGPRNMQSIVFDKVTALTTAQAITSALLQREKTGQGQYLPISMLDSALYYMWPDMMWSRTLLGDGADRGLARRRIRRPLGGGYAAQGLAFSEREREGSDSLNELLAHLTASRSGLPSSSRARDAADSTAALTALEKMVAEEESRPPFAQGIVENTPAHAQEMALRSRFVQEMLLSSICANPASLLGLSLAPEEIWGAAPAAADADSPPEGAAEEGQEDRRLLREEHARAAVLALPTSVRSAAASRPGSNWGQMSWAERLMACASV